MVERKNADKVFLYKEFIMSPIPFTNCIIACPRYWDNFDKMLTTVVNQFPLEFTSKSSPSVWLLFPLGLSLATGPEFRGARIAGATSIMAATRLGASKYASTATREPAECLVSH